MRYILIQLVTLLALLTFTSCDTKKDSNTHRPLRVNIFDDPVSLDPRVVRLIKDLTVVKQLFDGLTRIDANGSPQPAIAKSVDVSEDLLTYTFHLREAYWTNGDPVTAHDFEYAWTRVLDPEFASDYSYMLYPIKNAKLAREGKCSTDAVGVAALDDRTLVVQLEAPTPYFLELVAFPTFFPVNQKIDSQVSGWAHPPCEHFVCNGPFKVKEWKPQTELALVKNPNYWDNSQVRLKALTFSILDDNNTESQLFEKNELDWLGQPTSRNLPTELIANVEEAHSYDVAGTYWLKFNTDREPFDQPKLRRAFSYAIKRDQIIEHILQGNQALATGPLPPSMQLQTEPYFQDGNMKLAKKLFEEVLAANGWTRETFPKVVLNFNPSERNTKIVQLIQQQWNKTFGIQVELGSVELHLYRRNIAEGKFQVGTGEWIADFNDPLAFLELFKNGNDIDATGWYNETFVQLLDQSLVENDREKRKEILLQAEKILVDEMPIAPVYHYAFDYVKKGYVKDVVLSPLGTADFKFATIE